MHKWRTPKGNGALPNVVQNMYGLSTTIMNLKSFWERHRAQRWAGTAVRQAKARTPKGFQPLTRQESINVLAGTIRWLKTEARATLAMSDGPSKERRSAELRARDRSIARDLVQLTRQPEG